MQLSHRLILTGAQGRQDHWVLGDGRGGETRVRVQGRIESNLGELLRDAAVAGQGIAIHSIWHVAAGIVPVGLIGFLAHGMIKRHLFSSFTVIIGLVLGALLMLAAEKSNRRTETTDVEQMTLKQAFFVGLFQILSLWPGFSRSGSTIAGGIFFGLDRKTAADFSFIIALPLMTLACVYDLAKNWSKLSTGDFQMLAVGFVVSYIVAYYSVIWFLRFLNKSTLASFAYYRIVLAGFSYYYFFWH